MHTIIVDDLFGRRAEKRNADKLALEYIGYWIKNPDPGSEFERASRFIRWMPTVWLIYLLRLFRYNGIIFLAEREPTVVGHVFFQKHGDALHLFSIFVNRDYRNQGLTSTMIQKFLEHAWESGHRRARIGTNRNKAMRKMRERFFEMRTNLPFTLTSEDDGWVTLTA